MKKPSDAPQSLTDAIEKLENIGNATAQDFKQILEKDYLEIKKSLEKLKPHLSQMQSTIETEVMKKKNEAESKVKENPWYALGIVAILALVVGLILGQSRNNKD